VKIRAALLAIVVTVVGLLGSPAAAEPGASGRYDVDPIRGDDTTGTGSVEQPFRTINRALAAARPGESVSLRPGEYFEDVQTVQPGVTVTGPRNAVLHGAGGDRVFQVHHDDATLRGFTIDGKVCADLVEACYRDKGIYVISTVAHDGVSGTKIVDMRLTNLGGECVRIKYFATRSLVEGSQVGPCGIYDFAVPNTTTGQNGEGIYLGTAPEQLIRNPSPEPDASNDNRIVRNIIDTQGAECVDIKEAARDNVVEFNTCTGQQPRNGNSGAMEARGPSNTFRFNHIHHNAAAGIRLGGDLPGDAVDNDIHNNVITNNARGGIKVQEFGPHGKICGNAMFANEGGNAVGTYKDQIGDPTAFCLPL
jgi:hypothetical protein